MKGKMMDKAALEELLAKVEAGEFMFVDWSFGGFPVGLSWDHVKGAYTGSLDAAMALHKAVLPGWWLQYLGHNLGGWGVRIESQGISIPNSTEPTRHDNPARAWLIAILKALIAQTEAK